jgi:hypothetical protein
MNAHDIISLLQLQTLALFQYTRVQNKLSDGTEVACCCLCRCGLFVKFGGNLYQESHQPFGTLPDMLCLNYLIYLHNTKCLKFGCKGTRIILLFRNLTFQNFEN